MSTKPETFIIFTQTKTGVGEGGLTKAFPFPLFLNPTKLSTLHSHNPPTHPP